MFRERNREDLKEIAAMRAILRDFPWLFGVKDTWDFNGFYGRLRVTKDTTQLRELLKAVTSPDKPKISLWIRWEAEGRGMSGDDGGVGVARITSDGRKSWAELIANRTYGQYNVTIFNIVVHVTDSVYPWNWYTVYRTRGGFGPMVEEISELCKVVRQN